MEETNKSILEEAKINLEEIKKFAVEAAKKDLQNEVENKINKIVNEALDNLSLNYDGDTNQVIVNLSPEEGEQKTVEINAETGEVVNDETQSSEEIEASDEIEEPIEITDPMDNIEEQNTAQEVPAAQAPETSEPADVNQDLVQNLAMALAAVLNPQSFGEMALEKGEGEQGATQDVEFINDEEPEASGEEIPGAEMPEAPAQTEQPVSLETPPATPADQPPTPTSEPAVTNPQAAEEPKPMAEEDSILEFDLNEMMNEDPIFEIEIPEEENINSPSEDPVFEVEIPEEENVEEVKGQSKIFRNTSNRLGLEPRVGTPNLQESLDKQKAHYVSKIDELKKENLSLNEEVKALNKKIEDYKEAFIGLREQFDEMQTFNAKLSYVNKIFSSGGLSIEEKTRIAEEFDKTSSVDEAKNLYSKIINEGTIKNIENVSSKIKANPTHSMKPTKDPIFESSEMKRMKELAGINKKTQN